MLFPRERGTPGFDVIWLSFDASSAVYFRSSLRPLLDGFRPPFNRLVHDLAVASTAAGGSLKSTPVGRSRWANHHLRYSIAHLLEAHSWHTPSGKEGDSDRIQRESPSADSCCLSPFEQGSLHRLTLQPIRASPALGSLHKPGIPMQELG
jgi:hypothetical protein